MIFVILLVIVSVLLSVDYGLTVSTQRRVKPKVKGLSRRFFTNIKVSNKRFFHSSHTPAASYSNAELSKSTVYRENRNKCGVYRWTNKITGSSYIGSSTNLTRRFVNYYSPVFLQKEVSKFKSIIYSALLKYGYSNFKLEILEYCEPSDVISREQYYLNLFKPDYNILTTAGSTQGYKHSKETLAKLKGRKHSSETREKLKIHLTKLNKVLNEKKGIKVEIFDLETNITNTYESIAKAARAINTQSKALLTIEKSELGSGIIKPYKGRYLITILRNVTKLSSLCDMPQKVELARQNIAIARTKWEAALGIKVIVTNIESKDLKEYDSISKAAEMLNTTRRTISSYIKNKKLYKGKYSISLK